jgi:hypothetical protein
MHFKSLLFRVCMYQRYNEVNLTTDAMQNREWRDDYCGESSTSRVSNQKGLTLLLTSIYTRITEKTPLQGTSAPLSAA